MTDQIVGDAKTGETPAAAQNTAALSFETWIEEQPDDVRTMLDGHTGSLKSALTQERESRKGLEKQLRDLAKRAEAGSDAQKGLTEMADEMSKVSQRADFYEAAHVAGVTNLKLAYLAATQDDLFGKNGQVDFAKMKTQFPELFQGTKPPLGHAGSGTTNQLPANKSGMDEIIRRKVGL
jgi:hypothetical protein